MTVAISSLVRPESSGAMSAGGMRESSRSARAVTPLASRRRRMRVVTFGVAIPEAPLQPPGPSGMAQAAGSRLGQPDWCSDRGSLFISS